MAGEISGSGTVLCPTCNAKAKTPGFGRDGSPRSTGRFFHELSMNPTHVKSRNAAKVIRKQNAATNQ